MSSFYVQPGVFFNEKDATLTVAGVSSTVGAIAGPFRWGPVGESVLIDTEVNLVKRFGAPTNLNAETFFSAASFLAYGTALQVSRAANTTGTSPLVSADVEAANAIISLASGDTTALIVGQTLIASEDVTVIAKATIASIVNASAFTITSAADAVGTSSSIALQFASNTAFSAVANTGPVATLAGQIVRTEDDFTANYGTYDSDVPFIARWPGAIGNSLRVSVCGNSTGYQETINLASTSYGTNTDFTVIPNSNTVSVVLTAASQTAANTAADTFVGHLNVGDLLELGNSAIGTQLMKITAIDDYTSNTTAAVVVIHFEDVFKLSSNVEFGKTSTSNTMTRYWEFYNLVDIAPGTSDYVTAHGNTAAKDELHLVVVDSGGKFTGVPGTVLEVYKNVSRATDSKQIDGSGNFYRDILNTESQYVWAVNDMSGAASNTAAHVTTATLDTLSLPFGLGADGQDETNMSLSIITNAYDVFGSDNNIDISLIITGRSGNFNLANYLIDNIAEDRRDCVVFVSPPKSAVVNNKGFEANACVVFANGMRASSYGFMDSGYKYMYDKYNDINRWVPLNGDMAGLCARTDITNDPWWSPAGYNRGKLKNVIKLAYNPSFADQATLYKASINPVISENGQGTLLFGDKTLLGKNSAFSRINVRRLFIVLEKAISSAAKFTLFEFNDAFTRAAFLNLVNPYLRTVKAARGVYDYLAKCDTDNNTGEVIDNNEFRGDIYIKPARSINAVTLNFIAVGTDVSFQEVEGI